MLVNVGKGIERDIDHTKLPQAALDHAIYIGLRNVLMDAHASITTDEYPNADERRAAAEAMVDKKLAALMSGEVRVASTREGDPVRAEAVRMAIGQIEDIIKANGKKVASYDRKVIREKALTRITPELLELARARVEQNKAATKGVGSLAELGL